MTLHRIDYNGGYVWVKSGDVVKDSPMLFTKNTIPHFSIAESDLPNDGIRWSIVAQSPNLSLPNIPYVEIEEDVDKAFQKHLNEDWNIKQSDPFLIERHRIGFIEGYKAASAKKYTEEDIMRAFVAGGRIMHDKCIKYNWRGVYVGVSKNEFKKQKEQYINSLQPKVVSIEVETTTEWWDGVLNCWVAAEDDDTQHSRVVPVTDIRDGKTFLKVKSVQYET